MRFAEGGIVGPVGIVLVGESGPETIVPIQRSYSVRYIAFLLVLAMVAETADLLTYRPANEWWFITQWLGPTAPYLKAVLIAYLAFLAYVLPRLYARRVLLVASGFGLLGLASNIA